MSRIEKNWLEWAVFGLSVLLLLVVGGLLGWDALVVDDRPPNLVVQTPSIVRRGDALEATVHVSNAGDQAARMVTVEVRIVGGQAGEEQGSFQLELLPGGASQSGTVVFFVPPADDVRAEAHVAGYSLP